MRSLYYTAKHEYVVIEKPTPEPSYGEVVVTMRSSSICGSDLHIMSMHDARFLIDQDYHPVTPGHEPAGIITKTGPGVNTGKIGQRVAVYHKVGCGECEHCRTGNIVFCESGGALSGEYDGALADQLCISAGNCLPLPDQISFDDGAIMMCAGGTAYSGILKMQPQAGETAVIFGCGPLGLCSLLILKAMRLRVICVDIHKERLKLADKLGADHCIDGSDGVVEEHVYHLIHGFPVKAHSVVRKILELTGHNGADCVVECSAALPARIQAVDALTHQGRMVMLGLDNQYRYGKPFQLGIEPEKVIFKELQVFGSNVFPITLFDQIVKFMSSTNLSFEPLITHRYSLAQGNQAFRSAADPASGKVMINW